MSFILQFYFYLFSFQQQQQKRKKGRRKKKEKHISTSLLICIYINVVVFSFLNWIIEYYDYSPISVQLYGQPDVEIKKWNNEKEKRTNIG